MLASFNIHLSEPYWLLLTPLMVLVGVMLRRRLHAQALSFSHWLQNMGKEVYRHPLAALFTRQDTGAQKVKHRHYAFLINISVILLLLSLALTQPYRIGKRLPDPPQHRDVIFLLDTSVSMVLRDYVVQGERIDRLTMLKNVLSHFVDKLQGNRIQFIAYAEQAYTLVPLTNDYALLKFQLQRLQAASLTGRGSDLSQAMLYALHAQQQTVEQDARPVFVMLTDASRPARHIDPRVAAALVAEAGIRLHTIAIGAGSYAAEDTANVSLIYHPASFQLLEDIARLGNGQFFWAKDPDTLSAALQTIQNTEKRQAQTEPVYVQHALYFWPLAIALLWLMLIYMLALLRRGHTP